MRCILILSNSSVAIEETSDPAGELNLFPRRILAGTITLHDKVGGKTHVVHQGEAVGESVDNVHRGESGDKTTVLLITYAGTPGVPTSVPAPGEKAEC